MMKLENRKYVGKACATANKAVAAAKPEVGRQKRKRKVCQAGKEERDEAKNREEIVQRRRNGKAIEEKLRRRKS